jgi:putative methanogenesis marker protein 17
MSTLEYFQVESTEPAGGEIYRRIASTVITDHDLLRVLDRLRIFIDPKVPIFIAVGITRTVPRNVIVRDFSGITYDGSKVILSIADETYLAPLLEKLWVRYGKDQVIQPDRFTIELERTQEEGQSIEEMVVADPTEGLYKDLVYTMQVICPEGFKVKRQSFQNGRFWFVASENTLPEDVTPLVEEQFAIMQRGAL